MARQPFVEFAGNKRLLWIAEEWIRYAPQLAEWAMEHIVNRRDVWSQYTIKNDRISVVMLPTEFQIAVAFGSMIQLMSCFVVNVV